MPRLEAENFDASASCQLP